LVGVTQRCEVADIAETTISVISNAERAALREHFRARAARDRILVARAGEVGPEAAAAAGAIVMAGGAGMMGFTAAASRARGAEVVLLISTRPHEACQTSQCSRHQLQRDGPAIGCRGFDARRCCARGGGFERRPPAGGLAT
jgi:predicted Rossmann-fold nucleotide-binding protein